MHMNKFLIYKILQLVYGELFNTNNKFSKRLMRLFCRTPFKDFVYKFYKIFKKKNPILKTNNNDLFINNLDSQKILNNLNKSGICENINLKQIIIDNILLKIKDKKFQINRTKKNIYLDEKKNFKNIYLLRLFNPHKTIEVIDQIAHNNAIITSVREYVNSEPIILSSQIWWTFPHYDELGIASNPPGNEFGFHYDVDDFKFLKLFFYLNDVDSNSGPHVYIKNHNKKNFKEYLNRRITDDEANQYYKENIYTILGKTGNGFIEDTSFYHKGSNPKNNHNRGILQIVYGIKNWDNLS